MIAARRIWRGTRGRTRRAWLLFLLATGLGAAFLCWAVFHQHTFFSTQGPGASAAVPAIFAASLWLILALTAALAWRLAPRARWRQLRRRLSRYRAAKANRYRAQSTRLALRDEQLRGALQRLRELRSHSEALGQSHQQLQLSREALLSMTQDALLLTDASGRVVGASTAAGVLLQRSREALVGSALDDDTALQLAQTHQDAGRSLRTLVARVVAEASPIPRIEPATLRSDAAQTLPLMVTVAAVVNRNGKALGALLRLETATRARPAEGASEPAQAAVPEWDAGLLSRAPLERRVEELTATARSQGRHHVLLMLRLDDTGPIKDQHGFWAEEQALWHAARNFIAMLGTRSMGYRYANNRLATLLQDSDLQQGLAFAERLRLHAQHHPLVWEGRTIACTYSIAVLAIDGSLNRDTLLADAEALLSDARHRDGNCVLQAPAAVAPGTQHSGDDLWLQWITPRLRDGRAHLLTEAARPLHADSTPPLLHAYLRIEDDHGQWLAPDYYLPALVRLRQSQLVDLWMLRELLTLLGRDPPLREGHARACLPLSTASLLHPAFSAAAFKILAASPSSAAALCLLVDASVALSHADVLKAFILQLQPLGLRFGLHGYRDPRSAGALDGMALDYLLLHPQLTRDIAHDTLDRVQLTRLCSAVRQQRRHIVAIEVDSEDALEPLRLAGVDYALGPPRTTAQKKAR